MKIKATFNKAKDFVKRHSGKIAIAAAAVVAGIVAYKIQKEPPMGNNSYREHFRKDGRPKVSYETKQEANIKKYWHNFIYDTNMNAYRCTKCNQYHLGHPCTKTA